MALLGSLVRGAAPLFALSVNNAVFIGSLAAWDAGAMATGLNSDSRVCVVATAAAFRGARAAIDEVNDVLAPFEAALSAVAAIDRASADDPTVVAAVASADLVVLVDGAALHARSVWRHSALGVALAHAPLLCIGSTGSVLGATMIDPRGGAPTTGLGFFDDAVVCVPASLEQSVRTRGLLAGQLLIELGRRSAVAFDGHWRVVSGEDLEVSRGGDGVSLAEFSLEE